ncbi:MAG: hypothetical protein HY073_05810 [Deltaproteobacteria bacterium]|nr:hypothetical protein [Deltaproteobacteria bacterium]
MKKTLSAFIGLSAVLAFSSMALSHEHQTGASAAAPGRVIAPGNGNDHPDTVLHDHGHYDHVDQGEHKGEGQRPEGHAEHHEHHHHDEQHEHHHEGGEK